MTRLALALLLGLIAALVPILATSGQCRQTLTADAPRVLLLVSDESASQLACLLGSRIAFERVRDAGTATERLADESVSGIVVDAQTNPTLPPNEVGIWAVTGTGRAVFGLGLARSIGFRLNYNVDSTGFHLYPFGPSNTSGFEPPDARSFERGVLSISRIHFKTCAHSNGGGEGTFEYTQDVSAAGYILSTVQQSSCRFYEAPPPPTLP